MNQIIKRTPGLLLLALMALFIMGGSTSCKSKKKMAREQAAAEYAAKVTQAKTDLNAIIDGSTPWTLDQQKERVDVIKSYNIEDPEVVELIEKASAVISMRMAERDRKAEEERLRKEEEARLRAEQTKYAPIEKAFDAIAQAPGVDQANSLINSALTQYATPDVPVLIIISQAGGFNDYDRPTTISMFLNKVKDLKKSAWRVVTAKYDSNGKITELELIKK